MAITPRTGLPEFWVTGVAKALVGEKPCLLEVWAKGFYRFEKKVRAPSMIEWNLNHTTMLTAEVEAHRAAGWKTTVEKFFRLAGKHAILTGKPDLIAQGLAGKRPKIVDTKSGQPKDSDIAQVLIYGVAIPLAWSAPGLTFEGEVVYPSHRVQIAAHEVGPMRAKLFPFLKMLGTSPQPEPSPSEANCRFCDVPEELCTARVSGETATVTTEEF